MLNKGFTLIELLIVIAIIGILAGTVVVSLTGTTGKASDASIISSIQSIKPLIFSEALDNPTGDGTLCVDIRDKIGNDSKLNSSWTTTSGNDCAESDLNSASAGICCTSSGTSWVVWGSLSTYDGTSTTADDYYCIDHKNTVATLNNDSSVTLSSNGVSCS